MKFTRLTRKEKVLPSLARRACDIVRRLMEIIPRDPNEEELARAKTGR